MAVRRKGNACVQRPKGWCISCHQPGGQGYEASRLDLTSYDGLMKGTIFRAVVIPGQPDTSSNIALIFEGAKNN